MLPRSAFSSMPRANILPSSADSMSRSMGMDKRLGVSVATASVADAVLAGTYSPAAYTLNAAL